MVKSAHFDVRTVLLDTASFSKKGNKWELPEVTKGSIPCLKFPFHPNPVAFNLSSFKDITGSHQVMNFFLNYSRKCPHSMEIGKWKQSIIHIWKCQGSCPQMTGETFHVNSKNVIFENRIKSSTPSVSIIFLISYLLQACTRVIRAVSSGPWPFTAGDLWAVWEHSDQLSKSQRWAPS